MRCARRNMKPFYYALYLGKERMTDENGDYTGASRSVYSSPKLYRANISAAKSGSAIAEVFGNDIQYDRVIVIADSEFEIDENTVLCIDIPLEMNEDGTMLYDYVVTRVARSINSVSYAIRRVKAGEVL